MGVPTFGYLRIKAYLQLTAAYRSLSRPSSAPNAKAFSICSSSLELLLYIDLNILSVWPGSFSLATTHEISVDFFSSSYLDVSVRKVPSLKLWIHFNVIRHDSYGVSPFGHLRINAYLLLPEAYRSLSRPSSAPNAKAFSLCSFSLELILHLLSQISFLT